MLISIYFEHPSPREINAPIKRQERRQENRRTNNERPDRHLFMWPDSWRQSDRKTARHCEHQPDCFSHLLSARVSDRDRVLTLRQAADNSASMSDVPAIAIANGPPHCYFDSGVIFAKVSPVNRFRSLFSACALEAYASRIWEGMTQA